MNHNTISPHINSAKALHGYLKFENEKLALERKVQSSVLSMNEQQEKTNTNLKFSHNLTQEQVKLMRVLIDGQNAIKEEQTRNSDNAARADKVKFWMNFFILMLTIVGVGYAVAEFHIK